MHFVHDYTSPFGKLTIISDGKALIGLHFDTQVALKEGSAPSCKFQKLPIFEQTDAWLNLYFKGESPEFTPLLNLNSTPFRMTVWNLLLTIPYGKTITYGEIARKIEMQHGIKKMSAQAVGNAVGHNPIALIIPCHRVIGAKGNLVGYAGGLDRKQKLLALERSFNETNAFP